MTWREDYAKEAMQDGRHAARIGEDENPHPDGTTEARAWNLGWSGAKMTKHQITLLHARHPPLTEEEAS